MKNNHNNLSIAIVGYTGETGRKLLDEILRNDLFKRVLLIGRRFIGIDLCLYERISLKEQHVVDFDHLEDFEYLFMDLDAVYCCLGAPRHKENLLEKVDYEYVHNVAFLASKYGCKQFHLISTSGSCSKSLLFYFKIKGKIEIAVSQLKFDQLFIYRPRWLIGTDKEKIQINKIIVAKIMKQIKNIDPTLATTNVSYLAKSMIANTFLNNQKNLDKTHIINNERIYKCASIYQKSISEKNF